ncbi:hypothetical protein [Hyphomonas sp.]|uniref:hypothetical protein n=1 Tax=Hyphomonas sp. TaxID=87 RepID=UPI0025B9707B|nr:hypothetical protein [Hyphomonas sp.]
MKIILTATNQFSDVGGAACRLWIGATDDGVPVHAWIRAVSPQTHDEAVNARFAADLIDTGNAPGDFAAIDSRYVQ